MFHLQNVERYQETFKIAKLLQVSLPTPVCSESRCSVFRVCRILLDYGNWCHRAFATRGFLAPFGWDGSWCYLFNFDLFLSVRLSPVPLEPKPTPGNVDDSIKFFCLDVCDVISYTGDGTAEGLINLGHPNSS